jgi:hypothetical protein
MADAFTVTWQQDQQMINTAAQAKEIVPFAVSVDPIPAINTPYTHPIYSTSFNLAYIMIDGFFLGATIGTSAPQTNYYGLNFIHPVTPATTQLIIPMWAQLDRSIESSNASVSQLSNFYISGTSSSILVNYQMKSTPSISWRNALYCSGTLFIMS